MAAASGIAPDFAAQAAKRGALRGSEDCASRSAFLVPSEALICLSYTAVVARLWGNGKFGGAPGIRTPDTIAGVTVFKTAPSTIRTRSSFGKMAPRRGLAPRRPV